MNQRLSKTDSDAHARNEPFSSPETLIETEMTHRIQCDDCTIRTHRPYWKHGVGVSNSKKSPSSHDSY